MATNYHFRAATPEGKIQTGIVHGETEKWVANELRRRGLSPIYVGLQEKKSFELKIPLFRRSGRRDVLLFTQELSTLLNSSVPVDRALSITSELTERPVFRSVLQDVIRVLKGGKSLADSLATKPEYFSELYINMVRAGEASGSLAAVFERLAEFERTRDDLRNYIISSMVYPALLATVGTISVIFLLTFVVPRFAQVFEDSHLKMPLPTKIMLESSRVIKDYGWIALTTLVGAVVFFQAYIRTTGGRLKWDSFRLKIPVLGIALRKSEVARFARAMSTLVQNSVPLVQSIGIAGATLHNKRISSSLQSVAQGVKRGEGIAGPLRKAREFPPLAAHLLAVGEETGRLDQMFARMAEIYEAETRSAIRRFTALFEPVIILVMGIVVGALILSMLLAITSMNEVAI